MFSISGSRNRSRDDSYARRQEKRGSAGGKSATIDELDRREEEKNGRNGTQRLVSGRLELILLLLFIR
ncbi:hypothetical protein EVAR_52950_1 [Eumeta japonica]|uniref:Uncharacterized protein n=1 Tax=Eumeta variegata TaxID=151549 RepID=A0A4C1XPR5_EUMVA|nr:hypothetical protein EVAR_52950_1 [Eumeta japonica]